MRSKTNTLSSTLLAVQHERYIERSDSSWGHCAAVVDLSPLKSEANTGFFINHAWFAQDCLFIERAMDGNSYLHGAKHIADTGEMLFVYRYVSGFAVGESQGDPFSIYPGTIAISDYSRPFRGVQSAGVMQGLMFTHPTLGFNPGERQRLSLLTEKSVAGQFVHKTFDQLFSRLKAGTCELPLAETESLKDVLRVAIRGEGASEDVRTRARLALKTVICDFIEHRLSDLSFAPKSILNQFGVSRATLFRMFESEGGVQNYINYRRLYRAVFQISRNPLTRGEISKAASQWGFSSDANFNRAVKRAFGTRPSGLFGSPVQERELPPQTQSRWLSFRDHLLGTGYADYRARAYA